MERVRKLETRSKRELFLDRQELIQMLQQHGTTRIDENGAEVLRKSGESPERTKTIQQPWDLVAEVQGTVGHFPGID